MAVVPCVSFGRKLEPKDDAGVVLAEKLLLVFIVRCRHWRQQASGEAAVPQTIDTAELLVRRDENRSQVVCLAVLVLAEHQDSIPAIDGFVVAEMLNSPFCLPVPGFRIGAEGVALRRSAIHDRGRPHLADEDLVVPGMLIWRAEVEVSLQASAMVLVWMA